MRSLRLLPIAVLVAASAACTSGEKIEGSSAARQGGAPRRAAVPIAAEAVVQKAVPLDLQVIGTVEPSSTVTVHAQTTGQLTSIGFAEGDDVKEGEVLFTLDRRPLEAVVKQAEANLQRDMAQVENARMQAKRLRELADRGIATREQVETAQANLQALEGTIEADRASVENAQIALQYATISAPISGRTGALRVHLGGLVRVNDTTPLVIINRLSPINVTFAIPEAQLSALKSYMAKGALTVQVRPPNDTGPPSSGRLTFVDNAVDQTTGTIRVKGLFDNANQRLWPGQFVNVTVTLATDPDAIVAPSAAVQMGQDGPYVFVVKQDKTVEMRRIAVGRTHESGTIVTSGLTSGELVVTDGHLRLEPGSHVVIRNEAAKTGQ